MWRKLIPERSGKNYGIRIHILLLRDRSLKEKAREMTTAPLTKDFLRDWKGKGRGICGSLESVP